MAPTDYDGPLDFDEDPQTDFDFDALRFDLLSLGPAGYIVQADAEGNPIWVPVSSLSLPTVQGIQGVMGIPGRDGEPGPQGDRGFPGQNGTAGSTGATGATGATGQRGPEGPEGPIGERGPQGQKGDTGETGAAGADGQDGGGFLGYNPATPPASPSAYDDEFNDESLSGDWTTGSSGGGSSGTIDETTRPGYLRVPVTSGGTAAERFVYKTYTPGANAFTVVGRCYVNAQVANQVRIEVRDSSGTLIYALGVVQGNLFIVVDVGTFTTHSVSDWNPELGEYYFAITRDSGTNYSAYVSKDGMIWVRLTGKSLAGTVGRAYLYSFADTSNITEAWWDFFRTFPSETQEIGGV